MPINSLNSLLQNPTFKILATCQAIQDDQDPVLRQSKMTRSPYQLLALLLLWKITTEKSKDDVVKEINRICSQSGLAVAEFLTVPKLNNLVGQIDWDKIASDLNSSSSQFCTLHLPKKVIENLQESKSIPRGFLDKVVKEELSDKLTVVTTIKQQLEWIEPFYSRGQDLWEVPERTFKLSKGLIQECLKLKNQYDPKSSHLSTPIGAFNISVQKLTAESSQPIPDRYSVNIKKGKTDQLTAVLKEHTQINSGLYAAFNRAILSGEFPVLGILVALDGSAFLDKCGVGVKQTQYVEYAGCASGSYTPKPKQEYFYFDIEVNDVHALFDSLIAVNFSESKSAASSGKFKFQDVFISLNGCLAQRKRRDKYSEVDDIRSIRIYPESLSHQAVIESYYGERAIARLSANPGSLYGARNVKPTLDKVVKRNGQVVSENPAQSCTIL